MVELDEKDLLQANATIIAGVLILLSLVGSVTDSLQWYTRITMGAAIIPFIFSSFTLLLKSYQKKEIKPEERLRRAKQLTAAGLLYLVVAVIGLLIGLN